MKLRFDPDIECPNCGERKDDPVGYTMNQEGYEEASVEMKCDKCNRNFWYIIEFQRVIKSHL
jgi:hypothetical protein